MIGQEKRIGCKNRENHFNQEKIFLRDIFLLQNKIDKLPNKLQRNIKNFLIEKVTKIFDIKYDSLFIIFFVSGLSSRIQTIPKKIDRITINAKIYGDEFGLVSLLFVFFLLSFSRKEIVFFFHFYFAHFFFLTYMQTPHTKNLILFSSFQQSINSLFIRIYVYLFFYT